jgi:hypothetical protein
LKSRPSEAPCLVSRPRLQGLQEKQRIVDEALDARVARGADCSPDRGQLLAQLRGHGLQGLQEKQRIVDEALDARTARGAYCSQDRGQLLAQFRGHGLVCMDCRKSSGSSTRRLTPELPEELTLLQTKGKSLCRAPTKSAMPFLMPCTLCNRSEAQKNNSRVSTFTFRSFKKDASSILLTHSCSTKCRMVGRSDRSTWGRISSASRSFTCASTRIASIEARLRR